MRVIIAVAAMKKDKMGRRYGLMANDVRRAYFHAQAREEVFIELPDEDKSQEDIAEDRVGFLKLAMYGTRSAAAAWQERAVEALKAVGFTQGVSNPCVFHHPGRDLRTRLHGDYLFSAQARGRNWGG